MPNLLVFEYIAVFLVLFTFFFQTKICKAKNFSKHFTLLSLKHDAYFLQLPLLVLPTSEAVSYGQSRRKAAAAASKSAGTSAIEDITQKSELVPDQLALAATRTEAANIYRRGGTSYSTEGVNVDGECGQKKVE